MEIALIAITCVSNIICLFAGAMVGQKSVREQNIELPNPIKAIKDTVEKYKEDREAREEQERLERNLRNIEKYDGSELGQEEV